MVHPWRHDMTKNVALSPVAIIRKFVAAKQNVATVRLTGDIGAFTISRNGGEPVAMPHEAMEYVIEFGLQLLQDAYAGKADHRARVAAFDAKYDKLIGGALSSGLSLEDETAIECLALVKGGADRIKAATAGLKGRAVTVAKAKLANEVMAANEKFAAFVAKRLDEIKKVIIAGGDIEL